METKTPNKTCPLFGAHHTKVTTEGKWEIQRCACGLIRKYPKFQEPTGIALDNTYPVDWKGRI